MSMTRYPRYEKKRIHGVLTDRVASRCLHSSTCKICWRGLLAFILLALITGCGTPKVGLQPEYPPFKKGMFALWGKFGEVDSLQPTLRWQPFPRQEDRDRDEKGHLNGIEDVTYELRVWKTMTASSGELVYARERLRLPSHKLEEPLEHSTKYFWSVRAHFMRDGRARTIEWGLAGFLLRGETVPNPSCFRFKTPP
jgi:hypothetical protein